MCFRLLLNILFSPHLNILNLTKLDQTWFGQSKDLPKVWPQQGERLRNLFRLSTSDVMGTLLLNMHSAISAWKFRISAKRTNLFAYYEE